MSLAIDVANYTPVPTKEQIDCLTSSGYTRAIVGCSYGKVARAQMIAFIEGGMETEAYCWIAHPFQPLLVERALQAMRGLKVKRLWLDAEDDTHGRAPAAVRKDIADAVAYARRYGPEYKLGIYSAAWWWDPSTDRWTETFGLPLWFANYRSPSDLKESLLFGGWTKNDVAMWQYAGTIETCGLNTDRNLIFDETQEEEDLAITLALTFVPGQGVRLYALGSDAPRWITDAVQAADLEKSFGKPKELTWGTLVSLGAK